MLPNETGLVDASSSRVAIEQSNHESKRNEAETGFVVAAPASVAIEVLRLCVDPLSENSNTQRLVHSAWCVQRRVTFVGRVGREAVGSIWTFAWTSGGR